VEKRYVPLVGTSGYNYAEWKGSFYPADIKPAGMFAYYAARFATVEINYTFYRSLAPKTAEAWKAQAPSGFRYALKLPQRMSHVRRLRDCADSLAHFVSAARLLGDHIGPLLLQLPPTFRCDVARLDAFLALVPTGIPVAVEFRHDSWQSDEVYAVLRARNAALCIADFGDKTTPFVATARHGYFRLRDEGYTPADLARWAARMREPMASWDETFVYFKHEDAGKGPEFAAAFLGQFS
jgi:uncharacterized protein YecE (DUF72 family)